MLAMDHGSEEEEREYRVSDLRERPKSYKALSSLTGVPLADLKRMGKKQMRNLPVRHYNFDTSIFKTPMSALASHTRPPAVAAAPRPTDGWGVSDDDVDDDDDDDDDGDADDGVVGGAGSGSAGGGNANATSSSDPFAMLTARAAACEKQWNAPGTVVVPQTSTDALSSAFSSDAMASTPDVVVVVKKQKPAVVTAANPKPVAKAPGTEGTAAVAAAAGTHRPENGVAAASAPAQTTAVSAAEAATRGATTPPNTAAAIARARAKAERHASGSAATGDSGGGDGGGGHKADEDAAAAAESGPSRVVATVDEGLKQRVKAHGKRVRAMLNHELMKVQSRTKSLILVKKKLDNLAKSNAVKIKELRQGIETSTANICQLEKAHAYAKKQYDAADLAMNATRDKKTKLIQHLSMILSENEARKEQKLLELNAALDATILNAGNEVTQLVSRARHNLESALPKTVKVSRSEEVRIPSKAGQVAAWSFEVDGGLDVNFSAEFFRGKSALSFSVTVAERLKHGTGSYVSPEDGVLILRLDNSYSWWKSKTVKLRTAMAEALTE